ncbi:hypothetical protein HOB10_02940 [Candidatus Parcubacteria bacterium]|jgi:predicted translin family RNA/ssDNA-binding protein|nr:hypothetical protein [Candidatus Parcubacteria bacterium]
MSKAFSFDNIENQPGQLAQEVLRNNIDSALDDYSVLLKRRVEGQVDEKLEQQIQEQRQNLIQLSQQLDSQLELDDVFFERVSELLEVADKGIEIGRKELQDRSDGKSNIEAIISDMREYANQLARIDAQLLNVDTDSTESEEIILELKTMIRAMTSMAGEIQRVILSLEREDKADLIRRQVKIMNDLVSAIKHFDELDKDINKLKKIREHFYKHFDEAIFFYEELKDL